MIVCQHVTVMGKHEASALKTLVTACTACISFSGEEYVAFEGEEAGNHVLGILSKRSKKTERIAGQIAQTLSH